MMHEGGVLLHWLRKMQGEALFPPTGGGCFAETYRPQYGTGGANVFAPPAEFGSRLYTAETGVLSLPAGMFRVV